MNYFTELSIQLANQCDYLDRLSQVYPMTPDSTRTVSSSVWSRIEKSYIEGDNYSLIRALLELDLFPVKDSYVPYFRIDKSAIARNPQTVNRICGRVRELGLERLYEKITEPKETNRQIGPLFRRWVNTGALGVMPCDVDRFLATSDNAILNGSDSLLKKFAARELGFVRSDNKGFDLIARFNNSYVIGEAKFITDEGGHQNDQFLDAMTTLKTPTRADVHTVAILDGVLYIPGKKKMHSLITSQDVNVMSALILRDYLYSL